MLLEFSCFSAACSVIVVYWYCIDLKMYCVYSRRGWRRKSIVSTDIPWVESTQVKYLLTKWPTSTFSFLYSCLVSLDGLVNKEWSRIMLQHRNPTAAQSGIHLELLLYLLGNDSIMTRSVQQGLLVTCFAKQNGWLLSSPTHINACAGTCITLCTRSAVKWDFCVQKRKTRRTSCPYIEVHSMPFV